MCKKLWRLCEKKCTVWLWQNKILLQYSIFPKCLKEPLRTTAASGTLEGWNAIRKVKKPLKIICEDVPSLAIVEQGPAATFHPPKVLQGAILYDGYLRHLGGRECIKNSPKTFIDYMRRIPELGYCRTRSYYNIPCPQGASRSHCTRRLLEAPLGAGMQQEKTKNLWRLYEKKCSIW